MGATNRTVASAQLAAAIAWVALSGCGGATQTGGSSPTGDADASTPANDAEPSDAGRSDAAPDAVAVALVPCNDGTGSTDCCPPSVIDGTACGGADITCWTPCNNGFRGQRYCGGGMSGAGHGLFACGDAGDSIQN